MYLFDSDDLANIDNADVNSWMGKDLEIRIVFSFLEDLFPTL
jgi:hypothetical protein